jgi:hypothetical protein
MAEPHYIIYTSACLLLDPLKLWLELSFIFGLSICTATAKNCSVGSEIIVLGFFAADLGWGILQKEFRCVSNCEEVENMLLSPYRKKSLPTGYFLKARSISSAGTL